MIDHMTLTVRDLARSKAFYSGALAPLGYRVLMEFDGMCGLGAAGKPDFWLKEGNPPTTPQHIAFTAGRRTEVDAFHAAAIAAGGRDNGPPGVRPDYHASYYAAFAFDPEDHNIEVVNHREPKAKARKAPARGAKRRAKRAKPAARKAKAGRRARR